ncbi:hypothetical protein F6453_2748 [Marinobacter nauticus]|uniref:Uncharacterized protein n=1 Tax=Marinobacter nauticus TaxID=2743 RepID=A0A833JNQ9_MARNT|nr:hypothetical protein F6453_2748 [Marinobacter nauticus]
MHEGFWGGLSKNRYEHIHVRFSQAIHGLRNFWKAHPKTLPRHLYWILQA